MTGKILILSQGLWRLRQEVASLTGLEPVRSFGLPQKAAAIAGWGHKPTADRARRMARSSGIPYIAIEDGFLRSIKPGNAMRPLAMAMDRTGIYYDARQASDLESQIESGSTTAEERLRGEAAMATLRGLRLSKYNAAPETFHPGLDQCSLVIDQTAGDASIAGGLANAASFDLMVDAALRDADGAQVVLKLHPETVAGQKGGFLSRYAGDPRVTVISTPCNPWDLLARARRVYTVSSQLGFEALMAGREVHCFGAPFYAGWGLTQDHAALPRRVRRASLAEIFVAAYLRYSHYFDAWTRNPIGIETAIDQLAYLRAQYLGNTTPLVFYRMPGWKRKPLERIFDGPVAAPVMTRSLDEAIGRARQTGRAIAAWGKDANAVRSTVNAQGLRLISAEDGFLRSAGLGAALTPSLSFSLDSKGIYYDPSHESDLEDLLQTHDVSDAELERVAWLKAEIVANNLSKYNLSSGAAIPMLPETQRKILVIGQVADDEAVLKSSSNPARNINEVILARVRAEHPDAFVIYKPHPDVERLGRAGKIEETTLLTLCNAVFSDVPIGAALDAADEVAVFTSLAGFEALIRGKAVRTFGRPFYAGWGLTIDAETFPRRTRVRNIDELLAISLLVYPHYFDPVSQLPCPAEVAILRLMELKDRKPTLNDGLREALGRGILLYRRLRNAST